MENQGEGLTWLRAQSRDGHWRYGASADSVIHPGVTLEVASLTRANNVTDIPPQGVAFKYAIACDGQALVEAEHVDPNADLDLSSSKESPYVVHGHRQAAASRLRRQAGGTLNPALAAAPAGARGRQAPDCRARAEPGKGRISPKHASAHYNPCKCGYGVRVPEPPLSQSSYVGCASNKRQNLPPLPNKLVRSGSWRSVPWTPAMRGLLSPEFGPLGRRASPGGF
jgi:hypothetical protein